MVQLIQLTLFLPIAAVIRFVRHGNSGHLCKAAAVRHTTVIGITIGTVACNITPATYIHMNPQYWHQ